jgi:IS5 family transposase
MSQMEEPLNPPSGVVVEDFTKFNATLHKIVSSVLRRIDRTRDAELRDELKAEANYNFVAFYPKMDATQAPAVWMWKRVYGSLLEYVRTGMKTKIRESSERVLAFQRERQTAQNKRNQFLVSELHPKLQEVLRICIENRFETQQELAKYLARKLGCKTTQARQRLLTLKTLL